MQIEHYDPMNQICERQSPCARLQPPPRPPAFPKLLLLNTSTVTNDLPSSSTILSLILLFSLIAILLLILAIKFECYQRSRLKTSKCQTNECPSLSTIVPTFDEYFHQSTTTSTQPDSSDKISRTNIYEEISVSSNDHHHQHFCACCSCTLAHYHREKHCRSFITPFYYTYEASLFGHVCKTCFFQSLSQHQQYSSENLFLPIE